MRLFVLAFIALLLASSFGCAKLREERREERREEQREEQRRHRHPPPQPTPFPSPVTYISQSGGSASCGADGTQTTQSASWFNTNAAGGNTYMLCGTFTGTANAPAMLTIPADGTSAAPLIVQAETNALFTAPYWNGNYIDSGELHGAIVNSHNYVILDGGTGGTIQNTTNGDGQTYALSSWGMSSTGSNVIIRNWTIKNIFVATSGAFTGQGDRTADVMIAGTNVTVCNNMLTYAYAGVMDVATGSPSTQVNDCTVNTFGTGVNIFLNTFQNQPWNVNVSPGAAASPNIYANYFQLAGPWGIHVNGCSTGNDAHTDGVIVYNTGNVVVTPFIYNNSFIGDLGADCPTAQVYCSYGTTPGGSACSIFNNLMVNTGSSSAIEGAVILGNGSGQTIGPHFVYNNTAVNHTTTHWVANQYQSAGNDAYRNEIITTNSNNTGAFFYGYNTAAPYSILSSDYLLYYDTTSGATSDWWVHNVTYNSLSAWQTGCTSGGGSPCDAHSVYGNPNLDSNYNLQSGSPGIGAGANLTSSCTGQMAPLCSDKPPNVGYGGSLTGSKNRPSSGAWDMGAYQTGTPGSQPPLTLYQQPTPPNVGNLTGAGTVVTPIPFGYRVARCTDVNTSTQSVLYKSYEVTDAGNGYDQDWNADGTKLAVVLMATGTGTVVFFNRNTMQCTSPFPTFSMSTGRAWSRTNPNLLYNLSITGLLTPWTVIASPPSITAGPTFDFTTCPGMPSSSSITWRVLGGTSPSGVVIAGFSTDPGGQDTGFYVAAYDPTTGGCQTYNTQTGAITASGGYGVTGTATTNYPFKLHTIVFWPGGWAELEDGINTCIGCPTGNGPMLWQVGTLNTTMPVPPLTGGHTSGGYTNWYNLWNSPQICARPFSNPTTCRQVNAATTAFPGNQNTHMAYQAADPAETKPLIEVETVQPNPATYGAAMTAPLEEQVFLVYPTTGNYLPITFTFTTALNNNVSQNFRTVQAVPTEDPTGNFVAFVSDWMGTLGNYDGVTSTCTSGGWAWNHIAAGFTYPVGYQIEPNTSGNAGKYVFQATVSGPRGTTEPTWPQAAGATVTETGSSLTWQNMGTQPNCRSDVFIAALPQSTVVPGPTCTAPFCTTGKFSSSGKFQAH